MDFKLLLDEKILMFGITRTFLRNVILQFQNIYLDWVPYIKTWVPQIEGMHH